MVKKKNFNYFLLGLIAVLVIIGIITSYFFLKMTSSKIKILYKNEEHLSLTIEPKPIRQYYVSTRYLPKNETYMMTIFYFNSDKDASAFFDKFLDTYTSSKTVILNESKLLCYKVTSLRTNIIAYDCLFDSKIYFINGNENYLKEFIEELVRVV